MRYHQQLSKHSHFWNCIFCKFFLLFPVSSDHGYKNIFEQHSSQCNVFMIKICEIKIFLFLKGTCKKILKNYIAIAHCDVIRLLWRHKSDFLNFSLVSNRAKMPPFSYFLWLISSRISYYLETDLNLSQTYLYTYNSCKFEVAGIKKSFLKFRFVEAFSKNWGIFGRYLN